MDEDCPGACRNLELTDTDLWGHRYIRCLDCGSHTNEDTYYHYYLSTRSAL